MPDVKVAVRLYPSAREDSLPCASRKLVGMNKLSTLMLNTISGFSLVSTVQGTPRSSVSTVPLSETRPGDTLSTQSAHFIFED